MVESFTIIPKLAINPATGFVGTEVSVSGTGFSPGEVFLKYDGEEIAIATANERGDFQTAFKVPPSIVGEHQITTEPVPTTETFTIVPKLIREPACGGVGTEVRVSGTGFPHGRVSLQYDGKIMARANVNDVGNFSAAFEAPSSIAGEHQLTTRPASTIETFIMTPRIAIDIASGRVRTKVGLSGTGFSPGKVSIKYDGGEVATAIADDAGSFQVTFEIPPSYAGEHQITTKPASTTEVFIVIPRIAIKPASGFVGTEVSLKGMDFVPGEVSIRYDGEEIAIATADDKGDFQTALEVPPSVAGEHLITTAPALAIETFTIVPKLAIEPDSGFAGTGVRVSGTGFPSRRISIRYDDKEVAIATADDKGDFQTALEVPPSVAGEHQVTTEPVSTTETFTIAPKLIIEPASGVVGTEVRVSGTGFLPGRVSTRYDDKEIATATADGNGNLSVTFEIPSSLGGEHQITTEPASTLETFTLIPKIAINPVSGFVGTRVVLDGTGFPSGRVSVRYNDREAATAIADERGFLRSSFEIPPSTAGGHPITTEPVLTTETFAVVPKLAIRPASGPVGTEVSFSATGFPAGRVSIRYDDEEIATATANEKGSLSVTFEIPSSPGGKHQITTEPPSTTESFTVTPELIMEPPGGSVGTEVVVSGTGFAKEEVSIQYDDMVVATASVNGKGSFQVSFRIPPGVAGGHRITSNVESGVKIFTVIPQVSIQPATGPVGTKVTVAGTGFPPGEVSIKYEAFNVATITADSEGNFETAFEVPPSVAGKHQIITIPASTGEAFVVVPDIRLLPPRGLGVTSVVGTGFAANSNVTITSGDTVLPTVPLGAITDSYGNFTIMITLPSTTPGDYTISAQTEEDTASSTLTLVGTTGPAAPSEAPATYGCIVALTLVIAILAIIVSIVAVVK